MAFRLVPILALAGVVILHAQQPRSTSRPVTPLQGGLATVPPCSANDLSLATDGEDGNFNGMSHSGTLVVLRNLGPHACSVRAIPQIQFADKNGPLPARPQMAGFTRPGLGHGPVVLPVIVAAGAELTSLLRWVSGEVYGKNVCISPTSLAVTIGDSKQTTDFNGHLCGDATAGGVLYEQTRFAPDPVYVPGPAQVPDATAGKPPTP